MIHVARTRARDDLAEMFCKRMASVTKLAKAELAEIREREAEISERLIISYRSGLGCLDPHSTETADAATALRRARRIVEDAGGFDAQLAEIEAVSAHHANNYMPLVANHRRRDRAMMFAFTSVVELEATSADRSVLDAVAHALAHAHLTRDFIPDHRDGVRVDLSFASEQWQRIIIDRDHPGQLHRRYFEACVFTYLASELRTGDPRRRGRALAVHRRADQTLRRVRHRRAHRPSPTHSTRTSICSHRRPPRQREHRSIPALGAASRFEKQQRPDACGTTSAAVPERVWR